MKCSRIMTGDPKVCISEDKVFVAIGIMWDYDCGDTLVVKNLESKELIGIVTDRDIAMHVVKHNIHPSQVKVADCMSSPVITCLPEDPIEKAIQLMAKNQIRRVPVVNENGACVGIISQADLLSHADDVRNMKSIIRALRKISSSVSEGTIVESSDIAGSPTEHTEKGKEKSKEPNKE